jgi:hypothetical protein
MVTDGDTLASKLNAVVAAILSGHSGAARPPDARAGAVWSRSVAGGFEVLLYDGTADRLLASISAAGLVSPGNTVSPADLATAVATLDARIDQAGKFKGAFSAAATYAAGDTVVGPDSQIYAAPGVIAVGPWNPAQWTLLSVTPNTFKGVFSAASSYAANDVVVNPSGTLSMATAAVAPGAFNAANWQSLSEIPPVNYFKGNFSAAASYAANDVAVGPDLGIWRAAGAIAPGVWDATRWQSIGVQSAPVGSFVWHTGRAAPAGYLVADGSAVTATHQALRDLYLADGSPYGTLGADPLLPNLVGAQRFIRAATNAAGVGALQSDAFQDHGHRVSRQPTGTSGGLGEFLGAGETPGSTTRDNRVTVPVARTAGTPRTATETRPINIALLPCIKF